MIIDILNATVIDGIGDKPRTKCSLRIEGDRITTIWEGDPPPAMHAADRTINGAGKTVLPGIIDAHCHISYGEGRTAEEVDIYGGAEWAAVRAVWNSQKVLRAGVTSFCDPGSTWAVAVTARDAIANGMFPGPRIFAAGRHIAADGGFADYFPGWLGMPASAEGVLCSTKEQMTTEVRRQVKGRVDLVKISGDSQAQEKMDEAGPCFSDEEFEAIVATARRLGRKTTIHSRYAETVLAAVRAKVDWLIHASYMRRQDIGFVRDHNVPICPTLTFTANIVELGREVGVDARYVETKKRELDALADIHSRAHEAGIQMMAGSEAGFSVTPYGEWHTREIELMVKYLGMSPMAAIKAATSNNARTFGWTDVGVVKTGAVADLLVVDGDPLADVGLLGQQDKINAVFKAGVEVDRSGKIGPRARMSHERGLGVSTEVLIRH